MCVTGTGRSIPAASESCPDVRSESVDVSIRPMGAGGPLVRPIFFQEGHVDERMSGCRDVRGLSYVWTDLIWDTVDACDVDRHSIRNVLGVDKRPRSRPRERGSRERRWRSMSNYCHQLLIIIQSPLEKQIA